MTKSTHYAGFWLRVLADIIDSFLLDLITCLIVLMGLGVLFWLRQGGFQEGSIWEYFNSLMAQIVLVGVRGILSLGYFGWGTYRFGTTVGKRVFRIYVVSYPDQSAISLKQSILRCFGYIASYLPMGAGFLMIIFQPQKRGLHDLIARTVSVIRPTIAVIVIIHMAIMMTSSSVAQASLLPMAPEFQGAVANMNSSLGLEAGGSLLVTPIDERGVWVGPKVTLTTISFENSYQTDLSGGIQGIIWLANAVGPGLEVSYVVPRAERSSHFRIEPSFSVRLSRFREEGAWALRLALPYDTLYRWGMAAGVSLQLSGVPNIGEPK